MFQTKVYEIPQATRTSKGKAIQNFFELPAEENVNAIVNYSAKGEKKKYLMMVTKHGIIKKTPLEDFENIRRTGIIAISFKKGDQLEVGAAHGRRRSGGFGDAPGAIHPFRRETGAADGTHGARRPRDQTQETER